MDIRTVDGGFLCHNGVGVHQKDGILKLWNTNSENPDDPLTTKFTGAHRISAPKSGRTDRLTVIDRFGSVFKLDVQSERALNKAGFRLENGVEEVLPIDQNIAAAIDVKHMVSLVDFRELASKGMPRMAPKGGKLYCLVMDTNATEARTIVTYYLERVSGSYVASISMTEIGKFRGTEPKIPIVRPLEKDKIDGIAAYRVDRTHVIVALSSPKEVSLAVVNVVDCVLVSEHRCSPSGDQDTDAAYTGRVQFVADGANLGVVMADENNGLSTWWLRMPLLRPKLDPVYDVNVGATAIDVERLCDGISFASDPDGMRPMEMAFAPPVGLFPGPKETPRTQTETPPPPRSSWRLW